MPEYEGNSGVAEFRGQVDQEKERDLKEFEDRPVPAYYKRTNEGMRAIQGDARVSYDWVDKGIIDVSVKDLPDPDGVSSPADFDHHISWEDASRATQLLSEIQEQVGMGKNGDDFSQEDQSAGLDYAYGKRRIYDLYYGSDPIKVDKDGDHYDIVSGRHRIYAAKYHGLETIPANVREKM